MEKKIETFINQLAEIDDQNIDFENIYRGNGASQVRRNNLTSYLNKFISQQNIVLIVGEAPGYKGCKLTGVPFTSEKIIVNELFFRTGNFEFINESNKLSGESSATIVWSTFSEINIYPMIWNIFPFHPYKSDNSQSNRTPTDSEIQLGYLFLEKLISIFDIKFVVPVGKKAEQGLKEFNQKEVKGYVRHPANGGKNDFKSQLSKYLIQ